MWTSAIAAVLSEPEDAFEIMPILDPSASETYYGNPAGHPHTYEFIVKERMHFSAVLSSIGKQVTHDELSLIIVKEQQRGVTEVGRVTGTDAQWHSSYSHSLALALRESETLEVELDGGIYRLEVSTPENLSAYKLDINNGGTLSYKELFTARQVFGLSYISVLFAVRVYVPLLLLLVFLYYRKKRKHA